MRQVTLAAAPQIVQPSRQAIEQACGYIEQNATLKTLLIIIGAVFLIITIALLVIRKFWPQTPVGQSMNAPGGSKVIWCIAGMLTGLIVILPTQILPFLTAFVMTLVQVLLNIFAAILHL